MAKQKLTKLKLVISGLMCAALLGACTQNGDAPDSTEKDGSGDQNEEVAATGEDGNSVGNQQETGENTDPEELARQEEGIEPKASTAKGTASSDLSVEEASASIQGSIHIEKLSSGAIAYVYVPDNEQYGVRATVSPILVVYGNSAYTPETALETAYQSGLATIADKEQGTIVFVNPMGAEWGEGDEASLEAAKNLYSDSTNNDKKGSNFTMYGKNSAAGYAGSYCRVYVFAEGAGADFVYSQLSPGVDGAGQFFGKALIKPTAAFLMNPSSSEAVDLAASDGREIPVVLVNGTETIAAAYQALNKGTETLALTSNVKEGFDAEAVISGYDQVMEHYMVRVQSSLGVEDCKTTLLKIAGNEELGLTETKKEYTFADGTALSYYEWSDGKENEPLVLSFHGSGSSAESLVWAAGLNELAANEGFHLVSFENYSNQDLDNDKIMEAVDSIVAETKCDISRVYVCGFSMGSMRTWSLASNYTDKFAGAIAMNGFNFIGGSVESGAFKNEIPFYAYSGKESYLAAVFEFPNPENFAQELELLKANKVADNFNFDPSAGVWGITPTGTYTVTAEDLPDLAITVSQFADSEGRLLTCFAEASSAGHEPLRSATADAWKFISKFSRSADGTLVENTSQ